MLTSAWLRLIEASSSFPWSSWGMVVLIWISEVVFHRDWWSLVYWVEGLVLSALRDSLSVASLLLHVWNCFSLSCSWYYPLPSSSWDDLGGTCISLLEEGHFSCRLCCRGYIAVVCSINVMGVDFIAPVMMRSAWFWILSRDCWLVFAVVDHAVEL